MTKDIMKYTKGYMSNSEALESLSLRKGREYKVVKKISPSVVIVEDEDGMRQLVILKVEGYITK